MKLTGKIDGREVHEAVLESAEARLHILSYGAVIREWRVGPREVPVTLGFRDVADYPEHSRYFGAVVGRVANRIADGRFRLDGQEIVLPVNNGPNHLHGGPRGLGKTVWEMEADGDRAVRLSYLSPDGDQGYPGAVVFSVTYRLSGTRLTCEMAGRPDRPTPINMAHHNYYTLGAIGGIRDLRLQMDVDRYLPVNETQIPTGELASVDGTRFDFRAARTLWEADPEGLGIDHCLVFRDGRDPTEPAARLRSDETGLGLSLWTEEPGVQLFDAHPFEIARPGLSGERLGPYCGLCLEAQHFPDAPNQPHFPSIIRTPENPYFQRLVVDISESAGR
ncbi:MAG: aldose epimerase family protein [Pseudomonadota bacterium]